MIQLIVITLLLLLVGEVNFVQAQAMGTSRRLEIEFTSTLDRALFSFQYQNQKVSGVTPATKVFTLVEGYEVTVLFKKEGYHDCEKIFKAYWPKYNESQGKLIVDEEEKQLSFSAGATPPTVNCILQKKSDQG